MEAHLEHSDAVFTAAQEKPPSTGARPATHSGAGGGGGGRGGGGGEGRGEGGGGGRGGGGGLGVTIDLLCSSSPGEYLSQKSHFSQRQSWQSSYARHAAHVACLHCFTLESPLTFGLHTKVAGSTQLAHPPHARQAQRLQSGDSFPQSRLHHVMHRSFAKSPAMAEEQRGESVASQSSQPAQSPRLQSDAMGFFVPHHAWQPAATNGRGVAASACRANSSIGAGRRPSEAGNMAPK